jgi:hypothetical protein
MAVQLQLTRCPRVLHETWGMRICGVWYATFALIPPCRSHRLNSRILAISAKVINTIDLHLEQLRLLSYHYCLFPPTPQLQFFKYDGQSRICWSQWGNSALRLSMDFT